MRVECLDIFGRRNGCCRGAKGTMRQVEAEGSCYRCIGSEMSGLVCTTIASTGRANVEIPYAGTRQRVWEAEIGIVALDVV
jgi:hypothetical protein